MTGYVIQTAQGASASSPGTVTLAGSTRAGNTLIAMASVRNAGSSNGTLSAVTLGGVADNFAQAVSLGSGTGPAQLFWWLDPLCAGGQTQVVFTTTGGNGTEALTMDVLEVGGMFPVPAGPGAFDVLTAGTSTAGTAVWNSGTTGTSSWPQEIWTGLSAASGTHTATGPAYPWVDLTAQPNGTISITQAGYALTPWPGSASFSGSYTAAQPWVAGAVSFPCMPFAPVLPDYAAGDGPQQGDMYSLATVPLGFAQQQVVFRAAQLTTTTTLPSGEPGATTSLLWDTVYEDPYEGWNPSSQVWTVPFTGWYRLTYTLSVGACASSTILVLGSFSGLVMPTAGGIVQAVNNFFGSEGVGNTGFHAHIYGTSNVVTSNSPGSTVEITWLGLSPS